MLIMARFDRIVIAVAVTVFVTLGCRSTDRRSGLSADEVVRPDVECNGAGISVSVTRYSGNRATLEITDQTGKKKLEAEYYKEDLAPPQASITVAFLGNQRGGLGIECEGRGTNEDGFLKLGSDEPKMLKCNFQAPGCGRP